MKRQFLLMTILCLAASLMRAERTYAAGQDLVVSILDNELDYSSIESDVPLVMIIYSIKNASENLIIRYTLKDYASWKNNLRIRNYVEMIGEDGSFEITVTPEEIQNDRYYHLLYVAYDKDGELTYDIHVFTASDTERENPVFTKTDNKMVFVDNPDLVFDKNSNNEVVNQEIPFTFYFENVSEFLKGKPLKLIFSTSDEEVGYVQVFDTQGNEFPVYGEEYLWNDNLPLMEAIQASKLVGVCEENKSYTFNVKCNKVFPDDEPLELDIDFVVVDRCFIGDEVYITVTEDPTANEELSADETRVWASGDRLFIRTPKAETARIVTFDGRLHRTLSLPAGESTVPMPKGMYIVRIGNRSYKVKL